MRKFYIFFLFVLGMNSLIFAQHDLKGPVPLNPEIRQGRLSNGLTYYVCRNTSPAGRANFHIIQNVGAILEEENQNGLAHFLEHMAFNGTLHFPGKLLIETLERHGVKFGSHINASTGQNETVYTLDEIPTHDEGLVDSCLLMLYDWSHFITLDDQKIEQERKVIIEEQRTTKDVKARLKEKTVPVLLKGSKYVKHDVIGDMSLIKTFERQTLIDFYTDWYRTDLQAIAVVGDVDVEQVEKKIIELFSNIPAVNNPKPREVFPIPSHDDVYYVLATDKEMPYSSISLNLISGATPPEKKNLDYMRNVLVESLYTLMMQARITELSNRKGSPFMAAGSKMQDFMRGYRVYVISATANGDQESKAFETIYTENERLKRFGFGIEELETTKRNLLDGFDRVYKNKDKISNGQLMAEIQAHFLTNEPSPGFEYHYDFAKRVIPTITVEEVSAKAREWINKKNGVISIVGPKQAIHLTKGDVMSIIKKVEKSTMEPWEGTTSTHAGGNSLLKGPLKGAKITSERALTPFAAEEWVLDNGARVIFRQSDQKQVMFTAFSPGGTSLCDLELLPSAMLLNDLVPAYGVGDHDATSLSRLLSRANVSCRVQLGALSENISGGCSPEGFETLMQLVYLHFEKPRFDKITHEVLMQRAVGALQSSPMNDSLQMIMNDHHPRALRYDAKLLDQVTLERVERVYRDRFKDASDFTFFIVGDVEVSVARALVEKYIGSIRSVHRKEQGRDHHVRCPKGITTREIELEMVDPKATVIQIYSKEMAYQLSDNLYMGILQAVLDLRCTRVIREEAGGTYGVSVQSSSSREPYGVYNLSFSFDCDPTRASELKGLLVNVIEELKRSGPTPDELTKIVARLRAQQEQAKSSDGYWMNVLVTHETEGMDMTDPKNFDEIINRLTPKDMQDFLLRFLDGVNLMDITFKPRI